MHVATFDDDSDCYQKRGKRRDVPGTLKLIWMKNDFFSLSSVDSE
jgi:hypothetical protein